MITDLLTDMNLMLNDMGVYGFDDTDGLEYALAESVTVAKLKWVIPVIGETYFNEIYAKDKSALTTFETYLYYALLYFSLNCFLDSIANKEQQIKPAESSSNSKKNVSKSSSGRIGKYDAASKWRDEAYKMLRNAGYVKSSTISRDGIETEWRTIPIQNNEGIWKVTT